MLSGLLVRCWYFTDEEAEVRRGDVADQGHRWRWNSNPSLLDCKASAFDPLHILLTSLPRGLSLALCSSLLPGCPAHMDGTSGMFPTCGDVAALLAGRMRAL